MSSLSSIHKLKTQLLRPGFLHDLIYTAGTNFVLLFIGLFTGMLAARLLGPEGRGELAAILLWPGLIVLIGGIGLPSALTYFVGRDPDSGSRLIVTTWLVLLPIAILSMIIGYILMPFLLAAQSTEVIAQARFFLLIIPISFTAAIYGAIQAWGEFKIWNALRILLAILYLGVLLIALFEEQRSPAYVAKGFLLTRVISPLILIWVATRYGLNFRTRPDWSKAKPMVSYGYKSMLGGVPNVLNGKLDQFIIAAFLSAQLLGIYAVAVSWSLLMGPLLNSISTVLFPHIAVSKSAHSARYKFLQSTRLTAGLLIALLVPFLLITRYAIPLIFGEEFSEAIGPALILIVAAGFWFMNSVLASGLRGIGQPSGVAWAQIIGLVVTIILLIALLPQYELIGAAVSSLAAYISVFILLMRRCRKQFEATAREIIWPTLNDLRQITTFSRKAIETQ